MSVIGPFCQSAGITETTIKCHNIPVVKEVTNGLALELKVYCDKNNYTSVQFMSLLGKINSDFQKASATAVVNKISYVKEQKKKLLHKKKVKGVQNVNELLSRTFNCPVVKATSEHNLKPRQNSSPQETCIASHDKTNENLNVEVVRTQELSSKSVQTELSTDSLKSDVKDLNVLKYKTRIQQKKLINVEAELKECREALQSLKGHYAIKNVKKRDETARRNLQRLRESQRTVVKQRRQLEMKTVEQSLFISLKKENEKLKCENMDLKDNIESMSECMEMEKSKKIALQKSNSYLNSEIANLRLQVRASKSCEIGCNCDEKATKMKLELCEKDQILSELEEKLEELNNRSIKTKNEKGVYNDNIRLCIMELAGLEVAIEKMSPVIQTVISHIVGHKIKDLPNATTSQKIVDEGHYICKTFIADKLDSAKNWGLGRDGTTRRKHKILDTSVTIDSGDVISLGFTRVAQETAETIQNITQKHLHELTSLKQKPEYLAETLSKLSFTMSDRAANEKLADKLLDEWRDQMLDKYEGDKEDILHFHCMAHVLLGLHNYSTPALKDFEQCLKNETGPLGSENISFFHPWKSETVASRVVRTVSDTFGPAGNHLGVRDRWEAFCSKNGVKSLIGNYRDNRFNAFFQTAAEVFVHRKDFIAVLETVSNPNKKLKAVKSDLQSNDIAAILQCLGLFYLKLTGPYWNLITCGKIKYLELYKHVEEIEKFLETLVSDPAHLLRKEQHWSSADPLDIANLSSYKLLAEALFEIHEEFQSTFFRVIPVVATAMLQCVRKQLVDFLPAGKFNKSKLHPITDFAPVTNLSCEHHFGDLDSSQKRRPHASYHHHSSVQMLKRNRKQLMNWIGKLDGDEKATLMTDARKGGRSMRKEHQEYEQKVLNTIHNKMITEKEKQITKSVKRQSTSCEKSSKSAKRKRNETSVSSEDKTVPEVNLKLNEYVAVAYQDDWYPGCVNRLINESSAEINFMSRCRKDGYFQWPSREDKQIIEKQFVLCTAFVPDCVSSGRQWFIKEHNSISEAYTKYHSMYF